MDDLIRVLKLANGLRSEDNDNPEYDRALFELIADMFPHPDVGTGDRAAELRRVADAISPPTARYLS